MKRISISTEFITLGQFLKYIGIINNGGEAKVFLLDNAVFVNKIRCFERGKKLKNGDFVDISKENYLIINNYDS